MRYTLEQIRDLPANSNSEPDAMGEALDLAQRLAAEALEAHPYAEPLESVFAVRFTQGDDLHRCDVIDGAETAADALAMAAQYAADAGEDVSGWTATAYTLAPALDAARRPFVVILEDPDGMGESPWTCYGADLAEAIADARQRWAEWAEDDETRPDVLRAYPGSIGDILDLPADVNAAPFEIEYFDADPDGEEGRAGDGYYYRLTGADSWSGAWHSEEEAEEEARAEIADAAHRAARAKPEA